MPGRRFEVETIAPIAENTWTVAAGPVRFGVEYRHLNEDTADEFFRREDSDGTMRTEFAGKSDEGLSLHVFDAETGEEALRFDCFKHEPHYHYIYANTDSPMNDRVDFDEIANDSLFVWALATLRSRLPAMILQTNRPALAAACDQGRYGWLNGLDEVDRYVAQVGALQSARS